MIIKEGHFILRFWNFWSRYTGLGSMLMWMSIRKVSDITAIYLCQIQ
jgi:hypothetical protein